MVTVFQPAPPPPDAVVFTRVKIFNNGSLPALSVSVSDVLTGPCDGPGRSVHQELACPGRGVRNVEVVNAQEPSRVTPADLEIALDIIRRAQPSDLERAISRFREGLRSDDTGGAETPGRVVLGSAEGSFGFEASGSGQVVEVPLLMAEAVVHPPSVEAHAPPSERDVTWAMAVLSLATTTGVLAGSKLGQPAPDTIRDVLQLFWEFQLAVVAGRAAESWRSRRQG